MSSMHFYGWKQGLKTGMYYLRTKPAVNAIQFTVDKTKIKAASKLKEVSTASVGLANMFTFTYIKVNSIIFARVLKKSLI